MTTVAGRRALALESLKQQWARLGMPERFEEATEQELLDLADPKHRKRGEELQNLRKRKMDKAVKKAEQARARASPL